MSKDEKFVRSIYPDAKCIETIAPIGNSYQVIYGGKMPTFFFPLRKMAWKQAAERIKEHMLEKLES